MKRKIRCDECGKRTDEWVPVGHRNLCVDCAPPAQPMSLLDILRKAITDRSSW